MEKLLANLRTTLHDELLTSGERKALKGRIRDEQLNDREIALLQSKIFDMAREHTNDPKANRLINWLEDAVKLLKTPPTAKETETEVFFSPGASCLNSIQRIIKGAVSTLYICVFTISDNRLAQSIIEAHQRGVSVKVITDNDKMYDTGSDILKLEKAGVPVRIDQSPNHMHHKFAIADKKTVLTGSYNWTRSAEQRNQENILITPSHRVVKAYLKEFDKLWNRFD